CIFNCATDDFDVLVHVQRGRFPGGTDGYDSMGALFDVKIHQLLQRIPIQRTICEHRGSQSNQAALNHKRTPSTIKKDMLLGRYALNKRKAAPERRVSAPGLDNGESGPDYSLLRNRFPRLSRLSQDVRQGQYVKVH